MQHIKTEEETGFTTKGEVRIVGNDANTEKKGCIF